MKNFRINIRKYRISDKEKIAGWTKDKELTQWFTFADINLTDEDIENFIDQQINNKTKKPKFINFVIYDVNDEKKSYIGSVGLKNIDYSNLSADITIVISNKFYIGAGYGQEALLLICSWGFCKIGLSKIFIHSIGHNTRAQKAYRKFGFRREKIYKNQILKNGILFDENVMNLRMDEFCKYR